MSRYTEQQLKTAFDELIADGGDWRDPIDAIIAMPTPDQMMLYRAAVIEYTASVPTFECCGDKCRVTAVGYYGLM